MSLSSLRPLSVGNVVNAGLVLYRSHLKSYLRVAFISTLWAILPFLAVILLPIPFLAGEPNYLLVVLFCLVWLGIWLYCLAKSHINQALIARLAFNHLTNRSESIKSARSELNSRLWRFLWTHILNNIILFLAYIGISIIGFIVGELPLRFAINYFRFNVAAIGLFSLLYLLSRFALLAAYIWVWSRVFIPDVVLAIEGSEVDAATAISRSWNLTKGFVIQIQGIILAATLVTIPIFNLAFIPGILALFIWFASIRTNPAAAGNTLGFMVILLMFLFGLVGLLVSPFWQAIKAVVYYNCRTRREGMGLELSDRTSHQAPNAVQFLQQVMLLTPESVQLEFALAGIGNRALALLIDNVVLLITQFLFWIIWGVFATEIVNLLTGILGSSEGIELWLLAIALLINFFIYVGYFVFFEVMWQGQTPGKRWAKIRVIRDDGRRVGIQQATLRALLRPVDDLLFIGAFLIFLNRREKRLGDLVAGTIVVQEEFQVAPANFPISESAQQLAQKLPEMANLSQLLPDDFATIREYLRRRNAMLPTAKNDLSLELTRQVRSIIDSPPLPSGVTPDVFLEAVYLAYQQRSLN